MSQLLTDPAAADADRQQQAAAAFVYAVDLALAAGLNPATLRAIARERTASRLALWRRWR